MVGHCSEVRLGTSNATTQLAPLRDQWFVVNALAPHHCSLQQRGLLCVCPPSSSESFPRPQTRDNKSMSEIVRLLLCVVGYFATVVQQWSPTPLCGLRHGVIRWVVRHCFVCVCVCFCLFLCMCVSVCV